MSGTELDAVLERVSTADDPRALLVELTLERLTEEDVALAEIARLAAIPRRLDREIVAALRGGVPDPERDAAILARLVELDVVDPGRAGRPAYHDSVRSLLLARLREDPEWREWFEKGSARLIQHFLARIDDTYESFLDVQRVAPLLRRANADRLRQISEAAERALIEPAVEASYHAILLDPERGCAQFEQLYEWHERRGFLLTCRALRAAVEVNLRDLAPEAFERRGAWLTYWDGRLHARLGEATEAETAYRAALDGMGDDVRLRMMTLDSLAILLQETNRLGEALEHAHERLSIARSAGRLEEERQGLFGIADLETQLGRFRAAARSLDALTSAALLDEDAATFALAQGLRGRLDVDLELNIYEVIGRLIGTLDIARTSAITAPMAAYVVTDALARGLRRDHPRLAITALAESAALLEALSMSPNRAEAAVIHVQFLIDAGLLRQAEETLASAAQERDAQPRADILSVTALLQSATGDLDGAIETYTAVLGLDGPGAPTPEQEVLALVNRADVEARLGRPEPARKDCETAARAAARLGHIPLQGVIGVVRGRLAIDAGRINEARSFLNDAESAVQDVPRYFTDYVFAAARLAHREGRHAEALQRYRQAGTLAHGLGMLDRVALFGGEEVVAAADAGDWRGAAEAAERTTFTARLLAERAAAGTDSAVRARDRLYASGMVAFHTLAAQPGADDEQLGDRALRLLAECARQEPGNALYRLSLAYTHVLRNAWEQAAAEFDAALKCAPELLGGTVVADRLVNSLMLIGDARRAAGDADGALEALGDAVQRAQARPDRIAAVELEIGDTLVSAGRHEEAERSYTRARDLSTGNSDATLRPVALARWAALRSVAGDPGMARTLWREALVAHSEAGDPSPYWTLLRDCSVLGDVVTRDETVLSLLGEIRDDPDTGGPMRTFLPQLRAAMPDTWVAKESLTLLAPDGGANVIASSEPLEPSIETDQYANMQGELLHREFPGFEEHELRETELLGGRRCFVRRFSWRPPDGEPVTQIQIYHAHGGRGYTATATTSTARFAELELQLRQVLEGLVINPS